MNSGAWLWNPGGDLAAPLELPAVPGKPLTTQGGSTLDDGSGNAILGGYLRSQPVATTGANGYAMTSGSATILTWTAPNDGKLHCASVACSYSASSNSSGGVIGWNLGTASITYSVSSGQTQSLTFPAWPVQPGQSVALVQSQGITAGTVTVYALIYVD